MTYAPISQTDSARESYTEMREYRKDLKVDDISDDDSRLVFYSTPTDTWGVLIYVIVKDLGEIAVGKFSASRVIRVAYAFVIMAINLFLQFMILWWVFDYVVKPALADIQTNYKLFHQDCFDSQGVFDQKKWDKFPADIKRSLCNAGLSQPSFLIAILFLWTLSMMVEFHDNLRLHRHLRQIPNLHKDDTHADQVLESETGATRAFLIALSWQTRTLIYMLIVLPKYIIMFALTYIGWVWLSASEDFAGLILNSLALGFVVTIDDLMFVSLFPEKVTERVAALKFAVAAKEYKNEDEKNEKNDVEVRQSIFRSIAIVIGAMILLFVYLRTQIVLPGYNDDLQPICHAGLKELPCSFKNYMRQDCFPYGLRGASGEV